MYDVAYLASSSLSKAELRLHFYNYVVHQRKAAAEVCVGRFRILKVREKEDASTAGCWKRPGSLSTAPRLLSARLAGTLIGVVTRLNQSHVRGSCHCLNQYTAST